MWSLKDSHRIFETDWIHEFYWNMTIIIITIITIIIIISIIIIY